MLKGRNGVADGFAIIILQKPAIQALKDYEKQSAAVKDPEFDPIALGN